MASRKSTISPTGHSAAKKTPPIRKPAWQAAFATKDDYDKSVASVVARIKSGEVQPREPDED